jgi:uncharacterized protein (DUF608 family)
MAKRAGYTKSQLYHRGPQITYSGRNLDEIAFPLGGIGAGSISLGGWGQLRDWEIMNRPAKGYAVKNGFFAIRARSKGKSVTKVLQGPVGGNLTGVGHGVKYPTGEGLPHFTKCTFRGEYPFAYVNMADPAMPVAVELEAWSPFIPLDDKDSSLPVAVITYTVKNTSASAVDVSLYGNMANPIGDDKAPGRLNEEMRTKGMSGIRYSHTELSGDSPRHGTMALAALVEGAEVQLSLEREAILGMLWHAKLWEEIAGNERLLRAAAERDGTGTVAVRMKLAARQSASVTFVIAWHFPNVEHWNKPECGCASCEPKTPTWKNWYATVWRDAWDVAKYTAANLDRMRSQTLAFHDALFSSTLPDYVLDAVSANVSILKTTTMLRLPDGTLYGFEGCSNTSGCCEGSCTHVWNYAQAQAFLFPALQRTMREADYKWSMSDEGQVQFRLPLPPGAKPEFRFHPAADGQMGTVMQMYREWLVSGDTAWMKSMWPLTKKALEFAWKYWDADRDGVMEGMQHNTYDIEFYGPNSMMETLYLGALRAGKRMAEAAGDPESARTYRTLFEKGSKWTDAKLFNGDYYEQKVNPDAHLAWPERYRKMSEDNGRDDKFPWPTQQYGKGCISDQLLGQWCATTYGLGHVLDAKKVRRTLKSIFRNNWRADLSEHPCLLRLYALGSEAGLLVATWPRGGRPGFPFMYADEVWPGIEYQVASHMIYEGLVDEGLSIARGVRERHRGDRRNPWDEFECGHHYARSLASYGVLTALSGFSFDMVEKRLGFAPRVFEKDFRCFWSVGSAWGMYTQKTSGKKAAFRLEVKYGSLELEALEVAPGGRLPRKISACVAGGAVTAGIEKADAGARIVFAGSVTIAAGECLEITA